MLSRHEALPNAQEPRAEESREAEGAGRGEIHDSLRVTTTTKWKRKEEVTKMWKNITMEARD